MVNRRELEKLIKNRAKQSRLDQQPLTKDSLRKMKLLPEQLEKLMLQMPSPQKYSNPATGILSPLIDSDYVK